MITPTHYMLLSAALFMIGVIGVMVRRNIIIIFMSIELILNAVNINLIAFCSCAEKAIRLMLTEFRISSIDMKMMMMLRRTITPIAPMMNRAADNNM